MSEDMLERNVARLLGTPTDEPSREFEARVASLLAAPERKRALLPAFALAASVALAFLVWVATRPSLPVSPASQDADPDVADPPVVPSTQDPNVPWRTDLQATRDAARSGGKPCVVLLGIEGGVNGVRKVEISLGASEEFKALCAKVPVAAIRCDDPADGALRQGFGLHNLNPWLVVYDSKGELLGARCAMPNFMLREDGPRYPALIIGLITEILARTESIEELERRWKAGSLDEKLLESFFVRLGDMWAYPRLVEVTEAVLNDANRPARIRDLARYHWFIGEVCGRAHSEPKNNGVATVAGRRLLVETKDPVLLEKLAELVWAWGYQEEFDFPAKVEAAVQEMAKDAGSEDAVRVLSAYSRKQVAEKEEELRKLPPGESFHRAFLCAQLGKAAETVEYFEKHPIGYERRLAEAREKLAREPRK